MTPETKESFSPLLAQPSNNISMLHTDFGTRSVIILTILSSNYDGQTGFVERSLKSLLIESDLAIKDN